MAVDLLEPVSRDMCVELGGLQGGVTEDLLDAPQVSAALKEMGGGTVPQAVRAEVGYLADLGNPRMDDPASARRVKASPTGAQEESWAAALVRHCRASGAEPVLDGADGGLTHGDGALAPALAQDAEGAAFTVQIVDVEPAEFAGSHTRAVKHLKNGEVTKAQGALRVHQVEQARGIVPRDHPGEVALALRGSKEQSQITRKQAAPAQMPGERTDGGSTAREGGA